MVTKERHGPSPANPKIQTLAMAFLCHAFRSFRSFVKSAGFSDRLDQLGRFPSTTGSLACGGAEESASSRLPSQGARSICSSEERTRLLGEDALSCNSFQELLWENALRGSKKCFDQNAHVV